MVEPAVMVEAQTIDRATMESPMLRLRSDMDRPAEPDGRRDLDAGANLSLSFGGCRERNRSREQTNREHLCDRSLAICEHAVCDFHDILPLPFAFRLFQPAYRETPVFATLLRATFFPEWVVRAMLRVGDGTMAEKRLRDKIGYKPGQAVLLLDLPEGLADPFAGVVRTAAEATKAQLGKQKFDLLLAFTRDRAALAAATPVLLGAASGEAKIWLAYPKKSGAIATDLTRDVGWEPMFDAGYIVVAIAAVDESWSAVRFRPKHKVKSSRFPGHG